MKARKAQEEDAESSKGTLSKEPSIENRLQALEKLSNSLMILPKETKSLKSRVYKLETIINVSFKTWFIKLFYTFSC